MYNDQKFTFAHHPSASSKGPRSFVEESGHDRGLGGHADDAGRQQDDGRREGAAAPQHAAAIPGVAADVFEPLSKNQINVDMVIQNISSDQSTTDVTFTVKRDDVARTKEILRKKSEINYKNIIHNDKVAKVSIVGAGMVSTPGVTYKMFRGLSDERINILAISTSEIKLSVIIDEDNTLKAVKKLHTIFDLD